MCKMKYSCHQECSVFHGWFVYLHKEQNRKHKSDLRFIGFLVEKCVAYQSRKSDFGWHRFHFSPCLMRRLSLLGSKKKMYKEPLSLAFFMALDSTEYWGMIREWVCLFLQTVKQRLPKSETLQSDPE